jgi:hypothetical protein
MVSVLALTLALAAPAAAQGTAGPGTGTTGVLLGAGVSFLTFEAIEDGETETFKGITVDVRKNIKSTGSIDLGIVGDLSWHKKGFGAEEVDFDVDLSLLSFMGGVRVTASQLDRVAPFGQALFGIVRSSVSGDVCDDFEDACESESDPAIGFGGGVDVRLTDRLNLRGQLDFFRVLSADDETGAENTNAIRFMIGISTRLGGS